MEPHSVEDRWWQRLQTMSYAASQNLHCFKQCARTVNGWVRDSHRSRERAIAFAQFAVRGTCGESMSSTRHPRSCSEDGMKACSSLLPVIIRFDCFLHWSSSAMTLSVDCQFWNASSAD